MFSQVGFFEILLIGVVLLLAVGPEQMPGVIRRVAKLFSQARDTSNNVRNEFMSTIHELEKASDVKTWGEDKPNSKSLTESASISGSTTADTDDGGGDIESSTDGASVDPSQSESDIEPKNDSVTDSSADGGFDTQPESEEKPSDLDEAVASETLDIATASDVRANSEHLEGRDGKGLEHEFGENQPSVDGEDSGEATLWSDDGGEVV